MNCPYENGRHSIRLRHYDYSSCGAYFVTVCTQGREYLLDSKPVRQMIWNTWDELSIRFDRVALDEFVVMPNHVHGILWITVGAPLRGCPQMTWNFRAGTGTRPYVTLFDVMYWFKSMTTTRYRYGVIDNWWPPFPGRLWQRNYYERIIRNDHELHALRQYIRGNPKYCDIDPGNYL